MRVARGSGWTISIARLSGGVRGLGMSRCRVWVSHGRQRLNDLSGTCMAGAGGATRTTGKRFGFPLTARAAVLVTLCGAILMWWKRGINSLLTDPKEEGELLQRNGLIQLWQLKLWLWAFGGLSTTRYLGRVLLSVTATGELPLGFEHLYCRWQVSSVLHFQGKSLVTEGMAALLPELGIV